MRKLLLSGASNSISIAFEATESIFVVKGGFEGFKGVATATGSILGLVLVLDFYVSDPHSFLFSFPYQRYWLNVTLLDFIGALR